MNVASRKKLFKILPTMMLIMGALTPGRAFAKTTTLLNTVFNRTTPIVIGPNRVLILGGKCAVIGKTQIILAGGELRNYGSLVFDNTKLYMTAGKLTGSGTITFGKDANFVISGPLHKSLVSGHIYNNGTIYWGGTTRCPIDCGSQLVVDNYKFFYVSNGNGGRGDIHSLWTNGVLVNHSGAAIIDISKGRGGTLNVMLVNEGHLILNAVPKSVILTSLPMPTLQITGGSIGQPGSTATTHIGSSHYLQLNIGNNPMAINSGTLNIVFDSGFKPGSGDIFDIIQAGTITGVRQFASFTPTDPPPFVTFKVVKNAQNNDVYRLTGFNG